MTRYARMVLGDCEEALQELQAGPSGTEWRRRWITAVTLLRAVGHVLHKVDGESNPEMENTIKHWWSDLKQQKPNPAIYWGFIELERNNVIKTYRIGAGQNVTVRPGAAILNHEYRQIGSTSSGPTTFENVMREGSFAGKDPRDLVGEAIEFWRANLDEIDQRALNAKGSQAKKQT